MLALIAAIVSLMPLAGIWLVEQGVPGMNTVGLGGYPNGASRAYLAYLAVALVWFGIGTAVWRAFSGARRGATTLVPDDHAQSRFAKLAVTVLVVECAFVAYLLFHEGAIGVVTGNLEKGNFKAQVSTLAWFGQAELIPMLAALVCAVYRLSPRRGGAKVLMGAVLLLTAVSAALWGEKAGVLVALVPAIVILMPHPRPARLFFYGAGALLTTVLLAAYYQRLTFSTAVTVVMARATVGNGDTPWYVWDLHQAHVEFPPYQATLVPVLGGRIASSLGVASRADADAWAMHDFGRVLTLVVKDWVPEVNTVTSHVTGTPFSEGLMAFGSPGFLIMSVLAGIITALNAGLLRSADRARRPLLAAMAATYFGAATMPWLNGGAVVGLLSVPLVAYLGVAALVGQMLLAFCGLRGHPRLSDPSRASMRRMP